MKTFLSIFALTIFSVVGYSQTRFSDEQLKKDVKPISGSLAVVNAIQPVTYSYKTKDYKQLELPTGTQYGFMVGNVEEVYPAAIISKNKYVTVGKNNIKATEIKAVDVQSLIPVLLSAIKEQQQQIDSLKEQVKALKK
ncbi:hypothetical protein GCM10027049_16140 [Mucilaginibacter puniceus]